VNLIDHDLALNGRAVRITRDANSLPYLSVMFDHLSEQQESRLLQIIYNPTNRFLQTRVISAAGSILLYIKSVFRGGSLLQSFKS
jgi:hypothetical protein